MRTDGAIAATALIKPELFVFQEARVNVELDFGPHRGTTKITPIAEDEICNMLVASKLEETEVFSFIQNRLI
jgi:inosine-uridine nucleoside N-ribohydrolase